MTKEEFNNLLKEYSPKVIINKYICGEINLTIYQIDKLITLNKGSVRNGKSKKNKKGK